MKRLIILLIIAITGLILWGLVSSVQKKSREREARLKAAAERKFEEVKITLIEGWTLDLIYKTLSEAGLGKTEDFVKAGEAVKKADYAFLESQPGKINLEGYLFPDTYRLAKNATQDDVLAVLLDTFGARLKQASAGTTAQNGYYILEGWKDLRVQGRTTSGLTLHELVTLASIVEKETGRSGESASSERLLEERKTVAGVFLNRLAIGQALQSDATVNFITRSGRAQSTTQDLEIDSPYNTYKYPGLPPGPIGAPSLSSLAAVFTPIKTEYLYFLHKQPSGEVVFSKTFEEHLQNKQRFLK